MATAALKKDRFWRLGGREFDVPWIDRWIQEDQPINMASFVFRKVSNDEGDCFLAGFRITQNDFRIRPQFFFKGNGYSIA